jgi:threonine/homoserine/homoserine lactone efflux protein
MELLTHLLFGLLVGFVGVIPPGLLNLTASKISVNRTFNAALFFVLGACFVVLFQVYIGVFFSKLITQNEAVLTVLEQLSVFIFIFLSVFFFVKAYRSKNLIKPKVYKKTRGLKLVVQGMLLSILNIFPIPFYIGFSSFLAGKGLFKYQFPEAHLFILGAALGTFFMLFLYIKYVKRFGFDSAKFAKNSNYLISLLTMTIAVFTLIKIVR